MKKLYNKTTMNKKKSMGISLVVSFLITGLVYHFTKSVMVFPIVFVLTFAFVRNFSLTIKIITHLVCSFIAYLLLKQFLPVNGSMIGYSLIGGGVVKYLLRKLLGKSFKSVFRYKLNKRTPLMDQIDRIGEGKSDYERGLMFEELVCDILNKHGYKNALTTSTLRAKGKLPKAIQGKPGGGEQGVDVIAFKDGKKIAIQCKLYKNKISNSAIQEIVAGGTLYGADKVMVITNQTFTEPAKTLAKANEVDLIGRVQLEKMAKKVA